MKARRHLAAYLVAHHPVDAADVLTPLAPEAASSALALATPDQAAQVLREMPPHHAAAVLAALPAESAPVVTVALRPRLAAGLLARLQEPARESILSDLPDDAARSVRNALAARPRTAAAMMDADALALPERLTAREALEVYRRAPTLGRYTLPVIDREHRLVGMINLREIISADPDQRVSALAVHNPQALRVDADAFTVLHHPGWQRFPSLPVVTEAGELAGMLRYRSMRELEVVMTAEIASAAGPSAAEALGELFSTGFAGVLEAVAGLGRRGDDG